MVTKFSREVRTQPKTIKKRNYKNFSVGKFLTEVQLHVEKSSFDKVINNDNVNEASALFSGTFGSILNKHAPLKVFQVRNNYSPWLSKETKTLMKERDRLRQEATHEGCSDKHEKYRNLRNEVNRKLEKDRKEYYRSKFYQENPSISAVWKNANDYLNTSKRSFSNTPTLIKHNGKVVTSPQEVANALNETFLQKVKNL